ncbi:MAG: carboxypeptidase regulatory-like domain-containing protein [Nitrospira sp.]|nr:carboxypeptidase regulatory-like domain-containing protein [Nitrospira sp.]
MNYVRVAMALALLMAAAPAWAYEETTVTDGGAITGTVTVAGGKPAPKGFNLITFPDPVYCGRISTGTGWRLLNDFTIASDGRLKDVVVLLKEIPRGKAFAFRPPTIEARDCQFQPFLTVVRDQAEVAIVNMDPVMHDIQAYETSQLGPRVLFNTPLPMNPHHPRMGVDAEYHKHIPGEPVKKDVHMTKGRRFFVMQCGFHAYMESWGLVIDNPYYAVTKGDGTFSIPDVPPGEYVLMAWHPSLGKMLEQKVTVPAKQTVQADFTIESPKGRRSAHEIEENPRFGLEALGKTVAIKPTLELQQP